MNTPDLPKFRVVVASAILLLWFVFHTADAFAGTRAVTPFFDASAGAVVTWLFGWPLLRKGGDE